MAYLRHIAIAQGFLDMTSISLGSLYGLTHSSRSQKDLWGKNQFNSAFPAALACYMRDQGLGAVMVKLQESLETECVVTNLDDIFGTELPNDQLFFDFEARYAPYASLVDHPLERIDLIIRKASQRIGKTGKSETVAGEFIRPLEVKLTVVPDNSTASNPSDKWFPEMVIRPATTKYCALSLASQISQADAKDIFHVMGRDVRDWGNISEVTALLPKVLDTLRLFQSHFLDCQKPIILQPIWRTQGKQPLLDKQAFDLFVWSDHALLNVIIDLASKNPSSITRYARSALRIARYLFEYGRAGVAHIDNIYASMTYEAQSDKEFTLNGQNTKRYLDHPRMHTPIVNREAVKDIILNGGERNLSPERRLDQTIFFSYKG